MVETRTGEFAGKSTSQTKALTRFKDSLGYSQDYVRERFQTAVRMYRLFSGIMPPEIQGTFSQVMLWFPYSIIQRELATSMKTMLEGGQWLNVIATDLRLEPQADIAKKWLIHQMIKVQKFERTVIPTMQSSYIFGNGYRFYGHMFKDVERTEPQEVIGEMGVVEGIEDQVITEQQGIITGQHMNFFNGFPSPGGGVMNPATDTMEAGLDYFIANLYMPKSFIEEQVKLGNFDKAEAGLMFGRKQADVEEDPAAEHKSDVTSASPAWKQFTAPEWIMKMRGEGKDMPMRYLCSWHFQRDKNKWTIIGDQRYVLYDGPPILSFWPVANFKHSYNLNEFFGFSLLETVEDLIISMILNFNMRFDYLAGSFNPTRYVPQALLDSLGGDKSAFDREPYKVTAYPHQAYSGGLQQHMFVDEMPDLTQQAFIEQSEMKGYLEDVISQHGSDSMNANTATVGAMLGAEDQAPKMLRAITNEMTGVQDSVEHTLRLGAKYVNDDKMIRTGREGLPWEKVNHSAITDGYGIEVTGARHMAQAEEMFKKQLSLAPMILGNPKMRGELEAAKQLLEAANYRNPDVIINGEPGAMPQAQSEPQMPGGVPSLQNDTRSATNRTTKNGAGRDVAAMAAMV